MTRVIGILALCIGVSQFAIAGGVAAPEINVESGVGALALLSGALLVIRGRRKK